MTESSPYRLELPWHVVEKPDHFVVEDASGFAIGHIFFAPAGKSDDAPGQMMRSEALAAAERMVSAQDAKLAIHRAAERIKAAEHELQQTSRKLH